MPRPEAEIKAGFYALPESIAPLIAQRIETKETSDAKNARYSVIDPCCGEGIALDLITRKLALSTEHSHNHLRHRATGRPRKRGRRTPRPRTPRRYIRR